MKLFDLNGDIGRGAVNSSPFHTAGALLEHMDYLGIERSLVSHVQGRELNPTIGNRFLLQELARVPAAADRLFPVFTINPACYYEHGAMDMLREHLASGSVRMLAAYPATCRHPLSHLEPVLGELEPYQPGLLWSTQQNPHGELDYRDLIDLAGRFPNITFICGKKMWPGFGSVLDAMRRRSNICVDISWLHMRRTIELLVRNFDAHRVFCGTGCKTHYGAAIAALAHAEIGDDERQAIAHGNLEQLLGLSPAKFTTAGGREDKPLWNALRHGKSVEAEILDAHGHIGGTNRSWYLPELDIASTAVDTIRHMDRLGIDHIIVSGESALFGDALEGNRQLENELEPFRSRFSGYLSFNPNFADTLTPELDRFFASGFFVGFKMLCDYWQRRVDDPAFLPALRYADQHRLAILFHTWSGPYNSPRMLTDLVRDFPNVTFLLGHSGGDTNGRLESIALAKAYPNVFLEFCGSFTTDYPWVDTFEQVGFDRVVFGSDGGGPHDQAWELGHLLSQPIPDENLRPVLAGNMKNILARRSKA